MNSNISYSAENGHAVRRLYTIFSCHNRRDELLRLVTWATRKRLAQPRRLYQNRLANEERRLIRYALRSPGLTRWAFRLQRLARWLNPPTLLFSPHRPLRNAFLHIFEEEKSPNGRPFGRLFIAIPCYTGCTGVQLNAPLSKGAHP